MRKFFRSFLIIPLLTLSFASECQKSDFAVKFVSVERTHRVDVMVNGYFFTSYMYSDVLKKPVLWPIKAPDGSVITRGYPLETRMGERVDHPHQFGLWFNYGDVNGLDFWNNSFNIPDSAKKSYGHIVHKTIVRTEDGARGLLEVIMEWVDNEGKPLLTEHTKYIFSGDKNSRIIDHISVLTAIADSVIFGDNKEGMFAIRVDRALEMPVNEQVVLTDAHGNPETIKKADNKGVTGMYYSSEGLKGDSVWGTRNDWVILKGRKDKTNISLAMFDNPKNPGYPAYFHARGYGLFSMNNFGQNVYDPKKEKRKFKLNKRESVTLYHRLYIQSGSELTSEEANKIFREFSSEY